MFPKFKTHIVNIDKYFDCKLESLKPTEHYLPLRQSWNAWRAVLKADYFQLSKRIPF